MTYVKTNIKTKGIERIEKCDNCKKLVRTWYPWWELKDEKYR